MFGGNKIVSLFQRRKTQKDNGPLRETDVGGYRHEDDILRIRLQLKYAHAHKRIGNETGIWTVKASSFYDAFRFMFQMCDSCHIAPIRRGDHLCFEAILPEAQGRLLLSDRTGNRRNTLAVITIEAVALPDIKEIRFVRDKKSSVCP